MSITTTVKKIRDRFYVARVWNEAGQCVSTASGYSADEALWAALAAFRRSGQGMV